MSIIKSLFLEFILISIFPSVVNAQAVINEVNPSGEWIELFKTSEGTVSLDGCILYFHSLDSSTSNTQNKHLDSSSNFLETEFYRLVNSGDSWLNNSSSDSVFLDCPNFDDGPYTYGDSIGTKSYARVPNGTGSFVVTSEISQGVANPSPTPTPRSEPTSSPTSTPTATPVPTPTKTPTPKPTVKPTPKPTVTPTESPIPSPEVLSATSTPSPTVLVAESKSFFILPFVLVGLGIVSIGGAFYPFFKKKFKEYNESHAQID